MNVLDDRDIARVVKLIPPELRELMLATQGLVVAGGLVRAAVTGERVSDVDIFASHEDTASLIAEAYRAKVYGRQIETPNAITVLCKDRKAVQFITRWTFTDPTTLVYSFDFSIARAAVWYERASGKWVSSCDSRFYPDLAARRLVFMAPKDNTAGGTLLRIQKFVRLGYRISAFQVAAVVMNLARQADADSHALQLIERLIKEVDPRSPEWAELDAERNGVATADAPPSDDDLTF